MLLVDRAVATIEASGGRAEPSVVVDALAAHVGRPYARGAVAQALVAKRIAYTDGNLLVVVREDPAS